MGYPTPEEQKKQRLKDRFVFLKQEYFSMLNILDFKLNGAYTAKDKRKVKDHVSDKEKQILMELPKELAEQLFQEVDKMLDPNGKKKKYTKKPKYFKVASLDK